MSMNELTEPNQPQSGDEMDKSTANDYTSICSLQRALCTLGFRCHINGKLDSETELALTEFQSNVQLPISGQPDLATLDALRRLRHAWEGKDCLE
jgi:N-acetyl-anhydromuramyl-L-alanine amidase AmpD